MRRETRIYQFTDENLLAVFDNCLEEREAVHRRAAKFARKYNMNDQYFLVSKNYGFINGCGVSGMTPYKNVRGRWKFKGPALDPKIWTKRERGQWPPHHRVKKTAKDVRAEWDAIGKWDFQPVIELIDWEAIFDDENFLNSVMISFGPWWVREKGLPLLCGMAYNLPSDPKKDYRPPRKLMKQLTHAQYKKLVGDYE